MRFAMIASIAAGILSVLTVAGVAANYLGIEVSNLATQKHLERHVEADQQAVRDLWQVIAQVDLRTSQDILERSEQSVSDAEEQLVIREELYRRCKVREAAGELRADEVCIPPKNAKALVALRKKGLRSAQEAFDAAKKRAMQP
jgi:hypothetical protein